MKEENLIANAPPVKDLANACSTQVRVTNRYWLALLGVTLVVVFPRDLPDGLTKLPFDLAVVPTSIFGLLGLIMVATITIAFCTAHAQVMRALDIANTIIRRTYKVPSAMAHDDSKELFDALCEPSIARVAPLAQIARGKYQFFSGRDDCPIWLMRLTAAYHIMLKSCSILVYWGVPALAMCIATARYHVREDFAWKLNRLVWLLVIMASFALIQMFFLELRQIVRASKDILRR